MRGVLNPPVRPTRNKTNQNEECGALALFFDRFLLPGRLTASQGGTTANPLL